MKIRTHSFLVLVLLLFIASPPCRGTDNCSLHIEKRKAKSGVEYTIFDIATLDLRFTVKRPSLKEDGAIRLSVPAAFTTNNDGVGGIYMNDGKVSNRGSVDKGLGGALVIVNGIGRIVDTARGAKFEDEKSLSQLQQTGASFFQQFLLVDAGAPSTYKDKSRFQRRAFVQLPNRQAVIESDRAITLSDFAKDLAVDLGAKNALYLDMGAWDEGWYVDPQNGKTQKIGLDRSLTWRQTNWLVFRERATKSTPKSFPTSIERLFAH